MMILKQLRALSSAEEFFKLLDVPFESRILNVARLHILRRMGEYLNKQDFRGMDESHAKSLCRDHLARAYADFVASSPLEQRVFKVLKDAVRPKGETLVPMSALTLRGQALDSVVESAEKGLVYE